MNYFRKHIAKKTQNIFAFSVVLSCLAACTASSAPTVPTASEATEASDPQLTVLASYPAGSFLENLEVQQDGRVLFTNYFSKTIEQLSAEGDTSTFATLTGFPVSLISIEGGYLVTAQSKNFMSGEPNNTQQFLLLDHNGNQTGQFDAPTALFLNGMVQLDNGDILVADSVAGAIWKVDLAAQSLELWLKHKALAGDPAQPNIPGANGLKRHSKGIAVSNTAQGSLFLISVDDNGQPTGAPERLAETGIIDDFWVADDDSIIFTTHTDVLKQLSADGLVTDVLGSGCNGCTAVAPYPLGQANTYIFINDGGFFFGESNQSTVALVRVN